MLDNNGRLGGKLSILDLCVVILVLALLAGFFMRGGTQTAAQILNANDEFYVVLVVERVRQFSVDAVSVGDVFFERHAAILGEVVETWAERSNELVRLDDGTLVEMDNEFRYNLFVKLRSQGFISDAEGYFIGGNNHVSAGQLLQIQSHNIFVNMFVQEVFS